MAAYDSLKSLVQQAIRTNGNNEITGQVLQNVLMAMIDELGGENGYAGVATPSTNPGTPDGKVFYFATEAGTYTHFDGATLAKGIHLLVFNGVTWSHQTLYTIDSEVTSGSNNLITSGAVYTKIINAINALDATVSKSAGADGLSLSLTETDGKVTSISGSIAPQTYDAYGAASAAQIAASADATNKVNAAKTQILGDAASDYNTLGKLEDKIQAEESRAAAAENALNTDKADKATTLAGYGINDAYTKTEVNGLVSTPHQNYVTVPTYASLPATGSADTIYRVSNYNGSTSQVDASVYSEYAWNGSGYTFLRVDSQIGEVFDITVYNSNTKYADLAAALGTNGANVPSSIRRGGMSVKFVQSSDNTYRQCRLLLSSFSANPGNWECSRPLINANSWFRNFIKEAWITPSFTKDWTTIYGQFRTVSGGRKAVFFYNDAQQTDYIGTVISEESNIFYFNGVVILIDWSAWPGASSVFQCDIDVMKNEQYAPTCYAYYLDKQQNDKITSLDNRVSAEITSLDNRVSAEITSLDNRVDKLEEKNNTLVLNTGIDEESFVISDFNETHKIKIGFEINRRDVSYRNACLNYKSVSLINKSDDTETSVGNFIDDVAPAWFTDGAEQLGANHRIFGNVYVVCSAPHGKTVADIGSVWSNGTHNFTITGIENSTSLYLLGDNKLQYPQWAFYRPSVNDTLTHVNGATHIDSFTISTIQNSELNSYRKPSMKIFIDDVQITQAGTYQFNVLKISEYYTVPNPASVLNVVKNNVGNYTQNIQQSIINGADTMFRIVNTFTFGDNGICFEATNLVMYQDVNFAQFGGIQHAISGDNKIYVPKDTIYRIPQSAPVSSTNVLKTNLEEGAAWLQDRIITYDTNIAFSMGYLPDYGDGGVNRDSLINSKAIYLSNSPKIYPLITDKTLATHKHASIVGWRKWIDRNSLGVVDGHAGVNNTDIFEYDNKLYIYADYNASGEYAINIPNKYRGKNVHILEKRGNVELLTPISSENILVTVNTDTVMYGYLVAQIS